MTPWRDIRSKVSGGESEIAKIREAVRAKAGIDDFRELVKLSEQGTSREVVMLGCRALGQTRSRLVVDLLLEMSRSPDEEIACEAIGALTVINSRRATRPLLKRLQDSTSEVVRNDIVFALGILADRRAERLLCHFVVMHPSEMTRALAAQSLAGAGGRKLTYEVLARATADPFPVVRWSALNSLGNLGQRRWAYLAEGCLNDDSVVETLPDRETVGQAAARAYEALTKTLCRWAT